MSENDGSGSRSQSAMDAFRAREPLQLTAQMLEEIEDGDINPLNSKPYPVGYREKLHHRRSRLYVDRPADAK